MEKIRLDIIGLSSSHSQIGHYALVLGESNGSRRLPIIIGGPEAQAIALELESIKTNRPMTHDLIYNIALHFDLNLQEVIINDLNEGIFFARLLLEVNGEIHEIDSRPSDAVAIGVRFKVPIYTYDKVLDEAGIIIDDENLSYEDEDGDSFLTQVEESDPIEEENLVPSSTPHTPAATNPRESISKLTKRLEEALAAEDYEKAAEIRDKINKLKG